MDAAKRKELAGKGVSLDADPRKLIAAVADAALSKKGK